MNKKNALISVWHKGGIVEFAQALVALGWTIWGSGGTAKSIRDAGVVVKDVSEVSGLQPVLGHRVVTLVPQVHGGLLATMAMVEEMEALGWPWFDLVCVDLYPLEGEISRHGCTPESVIEKTDIGGPTMLSSAAKGRRIVICDPADRKIVLEWLRTGEPDRDAFVNALGAKADFVVSHYRLLSARYHGNGRFEGFVGERVRECKYGENAWQTPAAQYSLGLDDPLALDKFELVAGQPPSYNNLVELDRQLQTITHIAAGFHFNFNRVPLIALGTKHGNCCGAAVSFDPTERAVVLEKMIEGDSLALHGGLVMVNFHIDESLAEILLSHLQPEGERRLLDGLTAPGFTNGALDMLKRKKDKCRFLQNANLFQLGRWSLDQAKRPRYVRGGFLVQPNYTFVLGLNAPYVERLGPELSLGEEQDVVLAWAIGSTSNSNTITIVRSDKLIANAVGQQDRFRCSMLAGGKVGKAEEDDRHLAGAVVYSDSFFPFPDGPKYLVEAGARVIFASSGSVHDADVKKVYEGTSVTALMAPDALVRGFFGH